MSLRKSPTMTPARLEANRRNAKKSTGPRTARGKAQSRMNSLRTGGRSRFYEDLFLALCDAPPGEVDRVAQATLTSEQAAHPLFADTVDMFCQAEIEVAEDFRWQLGGGASFRKNSFSGTNKADMSLKKKQTEIPVAGQPTRQLAPDASGKKNSF